MSKDVTLDDVARLSGVSSATASRALNNRGGVRADVRSKVLEVAESLGYRPNRAAQRLAGGTSSIIGLVLGHANIHSYPYAASLVQEIARAADENDLGLLLIIGSENPSSRVRHLMSDGLISGVIVSIASAWSQWVDELLSADIPAVMVGCGENSPAIRSVEVEGVESSAKIVGHLLDSGCRRVGTITGPRDRHDAMLRHDGYLLAHKRRSIEIPDGLVFHGDFERSTAYELADELLDQKPDGVFAGNDQMALAVCLRADERGIAIPNQLSVAGFDGSFRDPFQSPRITSVVQPYPKLAHSAVEVLTGLMNGDDDVSTVLIEPEIFLGDTTRQ